jgi:hypothetical protein
MIKRITSEETKEKQRLSHLGLKHKPMSKQGRENIRISHLGYKVKEETKRKLSENHKGKCFITDSGRKKLSLIHLGEKNPQWKGGITTINEKIRKSKEYRLWRKAVFERDNYACIWCGQKGGELHPDHIKPFSLYPELRFAIDNGRTLCIDCHKKTDTWGLNSKYYLK